MRCAAPALDYLRGSDKPPCRMRQSRERHQRDHNTPSRGRLARPVLSPHRRRCRVAAAELAVQRACTVRAQCHTTRHVSDVTLKIVLAVSTVNENAAVDELL